MVTQEKKFYAPIVRSYDQDLNKRWRIEWEEPTFNGKSSKRVVKYGNINKGKTVNERLRLAELFITRLNFKTSDQVAPCRKMPDVGAVNILDKTIELHKISWRRATLRVYKTITKAFCDFLGEQKPDEIKTDKVNDFFTHLRNNGASANKILKYRTLLKSLFEKAIEYNLTNYNPVLRIKISKVKSVSLRYFNDSQIALLRSQEMPNELFLGIQLLYYCFIRPAETRMLKVSDLNLENSYIELRSSISKNKRTQKVIIPNQFKPALEYLQNFPDDYYLVGKNGIPAKEPLPEKRLYVLHTVLLEKVKIVGRYSLYSWKHTGVVKAYRAGISLKDLQLQLRHYSLDMVNEYLKNLGVLDSYDLANRYPTL